MPWRALARNLDMVTASIADLALHSQIVNPRKLQGLCVGGLLLAMLGILAVVPIWGQDNSALVDGLSRRIENLEERTQSQAIDMAGVHGQIMVLQDQIATGLRVIERVFWATLAILGSIFYRGVAAIWSLRKGWLMPSESSRWTGQDRRKRHGTGP